MKPGMMTLLMIALIVLVMGIAWGLSRWEEMKEKQYREGFRAGYDYANDPTLPCPPLVCKVPKKKPRRSPRGQ